MIPKPYRRSLLLTALLAAILLGAAVIRVWLFTDLPDVNDLSAGLHQPSIRILDRRGRLLYEVIGDQPGRHNVVPLSTIPRSCTDATTATEDAHFYTNPGV